MDRSLPAWASPIFDGRRSLRHHHHRNRRGRRHHAHALAAAGARILVLERGDFVPREAENWDPAAVWRDLRYQTTENWLDERGRAVPPYTHYSVGGNSKFWGSVLYRLRREDFGAVEHADGVSPAWPIDYETLAPYYDRAERLYQVHGELGADPTDPPRGPFPSSARASRAGMARIVEQLRALGLHPSPLPLGLHRAGRSRRLRAVRHVQFVSVPCSARRATRSLLRASLAASGERHVVDASAYAERVLTDASGRRVEGVEVEREGRGVGLRRRSSSCRAGRSTRPRCCCGRPARHRTGWRTRPGSSGAATWRTWRR